MPARGAPRGGGHSRFRRRAPRHDGLVLEEQQRVADAGPLAVGHERRLQLQAFGIADASGRRTSAATARLPMVGGMARTWRQTASSGFTPAQRAGIEGAAQRPVVKRRFVELLQTRLHVGHEAVRVGAVDEPVVEA